MEPNVPASDCQKPSLGIKRVYLTLLERQSLLDSVAPFILLLLSSIHHLFLD